MDNKDTCKMLQLLIYLTRLVIGIAVIEHCVEVIDALLGTRIHVLFEFFLYIPHVHRSFDNVIVVLINRNKGIDERKS